MADSRTSSSSYTRRYRPRSSRTRGRKQQHDKPAVVEFALLEGPFNRTSGGDSEENRAEVRPITGQQALRRTPIDTEVRHSQDRQQASRRTLDVLPEAEVRPTTGQQALRRTPIDTEVRHSQDRQQAPRRTLDVLPEAEVRPTTGQQALCRTPLDLEVRHSQDRQQASRRTLDTTPADEVSPEGQLALRRTLSHQTNNRTAPNLDDISIGGDLTINSSLVPGLGIATTREICVAASNPTSSSSQLFDQILDNMGHPLSSINSDEEKAKYFHAKSSAIAAFRESFESVFRSSSIFPRSNSLCMNLPFGKLPSASPNLSGSFSSPHSKKSFAALARTDASLFKASPLNLCFVFEELHHGHEKSARALCKTGSMSPKRFEHAKRIHVIQQADIQVYAVAHASCPHHQTTMEELVAHLESDLSFTEWSFYGREQDHSNHFICVRNVFSSNHSIRQVDFRRIPLLVKRFHGHNLETKTVRQSTFADFGITCGVSHDTNRLSNGVTKPAVRNITRHALHYFEMLGMLASDMRPKFCDNIWEDPDFPDRHKTFSKRYIVDVPDIPFGAEAMRLATNTYTQRCGCHFDDHNSPKQSMAVVVSASHVVGEERVSMIGYSRKAVDDSLSRGSEMSPLISDVLKVYRGMADSRRQPCVGWKSGASEYDGPLGLGCLQAPCCLQPIGFVSVFALPSRIKYFNL